MIGKDLVGTRKEANEI